MEQDFEYRWCKYCLAKTKQKIIFYQESPLTSVEDSTNALFVELKLGYRVEGHQQKAFIENELRIFRIKKLIPFDHP